MPKSLAEFKEFYHTKLVNALTKAEAIRKKQATWVIESALRTGLIFLLLALLIYLHTTKHKDDLSSYMYLAAFAFCVLLFILTKGSFVKFDSYYSHHIMGEIVRFVEPSLSYEPKKYISLESYKASGLFSNHVDRYTGSDLISGKVGNTYIMFSQIHAQKEEEDTYEDSAGNKHTTKHWVTLFKGILFIADFNKHFSSRVIVVPKGHIFGAKGKKVNLEDPEFMKYFRVYGEDQVEARYILSTSLMRRILTLKEIANREIYLSFVPPNVYVGIPLDTIFRPSHFKSILHYPIYETYFLWLAFFVGIVDTLDLNTRIWSKMPQVTV